jgi:hypothetical protein
MIMKLDDDHDIDATTMQQEKEDDILFFLF